MSAFPGGPDKEHEDWIRHAAVEQARQIHRHSSDLTKILRDAETIAAFIFGEITTEKKRHSAAILTLVSNNKERTPTHD